MYFYKCSFIIINKSNEKILQIDLISNFFLKVVIVLYNEHN